MASAHSFPIDGVKPQDDDAFSNNAIDHFEHQSFPVAGRGMAALGRQLPGRAQPAPD
jgi:hypothetical protein